MLRTSFKNPGPVFFFAPHTPNPLMYVPQEFESMFHLRPVAAENEDFLYRAYPKDWTVARKPKIGPPKARWSNAGTQEGFTCVTAVRCSRSVSQSASPSNLSVTIYFLVP